MMRLPRAILFDLDETILTFGRRLDQLADVARDVAPPGAGISAEKLAETVDRHMSAFWAAEATREAWRTRPVEAMRAVVAGAFAELAEAPECGLTPQVAHAFADAFRIVRSAQIRPFAGAIETLDGLRERGVRLALVTNGPTEIQRPKIERFDLERRFDHIQVEGECGFGKPEPRAYLHALNALAARPAEAWIVGDNLEWEVAAPQKLGLYAVWCDGYDSGLPPQSPIRPNRIIHAVSELLV
jgi:putative hydrolase of the HAD superfamily